MAEAIHLDLNEPKLQTEEGLSSRIEEELNRVFGHTDVYVSSVRYGELDCQPTDSVTIVGNNKAWS